MKKKIRVKKEPIDSGFEDWINMSKIWERRGDLSKKDPSDLEFREHQILSQKIFEDGNVIEAFIVLHGLIEIQLNNIWHAFVTTNGIYDEPRVKPKPRKYSELTDLLYEFGLIDKKTHQNLTDFNAHRNLLAHNLFGNKKKQTNPKENKDNFEKGLLTSGDLPLLLVKYLHFKGKENPKFKKAFKKVFGVTP